MTTPQTVIACQARGPAQPIVMINPPLFLALLLDIAPPSPPEITAPEFADQLDHVDVTVSDSDAVVVAFDEVGEAIGSLSVWVDEVGVTWLAADYGDGYSLISINPLTEEITREGNLPDEVLVARAELLSVYIGDPADPQSKKGKDKSKHSWGKCAFNVAVGAGFCAAAKIGCVWWGVKAACACVPKVVKEFDPYKCPVIG